MTTFLANSALTWDMYFSSGAVVLALVIFFIYSAVFAIKSFEAYEDGAGAINLVVCILTIITIFGVTLYTNGYLNGLS